MGAESDGAGRGTQFTFTLPVAEEVADLATPDLAWGSKRARGAAQEGRRVLVMGDDSQALRYVRHILKIIPAARWS